MRSRDDLQGAEPKIELFLSGTRHPPDHPQGVEGGELYSEGLWKTLNFEP
jgi:hypothetical protein